MKDLKLIPRLQLAYCQMFHCVEQMTIGNNARHFWCRDCKEFRCVHDGMPIGGGFAYGGIVLSQETLDGFERLRKAAGYNMVNIRNKGKNGEREIVDLFVERMRKVEKELGITWHVVPSQNVKRCSSMQADGGGSDIVGIPGIAVEVKRNETLNVDAWWKQCCAQAHSGMMPILFYRKSRMTWRVVMYVMLPTPHKWYCAELSGRDFFEWFESYYRKHLVEELGVKPQ